MKRLSEFHDEQGVEVIADLIEPITNIITDDLNAAAKDGGVLEFAQSMLKNSAKDVMHVFAILSETKPEDYHCNAVEALQNALKLFEDEQLMELFGLQSIAPTSAGSASVNLEVEA